MSKCEVSINFDRDSRTYRGGETVSGNVTILTSDDIECKGVELKRFWRSHGRSTPHQSRVIKESLCQKISLRAGEAKVLPFSYTTEREPVSYQGHFFNIDHYILVAVDIPWAIDSRCKEVYQLVPGSIPGGLPFSRDKRPTFGVKQIKVGKLMTVAIAAMILLIVILLSIYLPYPAKYFLFSILVAIVFEILRRSIVRSKVGKVTLATPNKVVAPNELWPIELELSPKKALAIREVTVCIQCLETYSSRSVGRNKSTQVLQHTLYKETTTIDTALMLITGQSYQLKANIQLPETTAYSFRALNHKIEWYARVRIDIPSFPDWTKNVRLEMVPVEFVL